MSGTFTTLLIAGGVSLLLFGVRFLRLGLDRLFGERLGTWMNRLAHNRRTAFGSGLGLSVLAPSSTTVSVLAVQTVQSGSLKPRQVLSVMLGANIGLTIMVQLIALQIDQFAPVLLLVGVLLFQYTRSSRSRGIGQVLTSLGFIFLAMNIIREAVAESGLAQNEDFKSLVAIASGYPFLLALMAMVVTIVLQSSTATLGLLIGLAPSGAISLEMAVPVVLGANVGLAVTALIIGWAQVASRELALGNLLLKLLLAGVILALVGPMQRWLPEPDTQQISYWVAHLHSGYNIVLAMIGLPLVAPVSALCKRITPHPSPNDENVFGPRFIQGGPFGGVSLALGQSLREIMRVADIVDGMLRDVWIAMKSNNEDLAREVSRRDDRVDQLDQAIKTFLTRLVSEESGAREANEQMRQLRYLAELETIGDIIDRNISELVLKKLRLGAEFSEQGAEELDKFYSMVTENLQIAINAFATRDANLAHQLLRHKERIDEFERDLRDRHFVRLKEGLTETHETSSIHLDMLTHLKRINSALTHVAYAILQEPSEQKVETGSRDAE